MGCYLNSIVVHLWHWVIKWTFKLSMTGIEYNVLGRPIGHEISNLTDSQIRHANPILVFIWHTLSIPSILVNP